MLRVRMSLPFGFALVAAEVLFALDAGPARACGGCFHEPSGPSQVVATVVTDHRMAFSISPAQTVLWDQIVYSGNPSDFAWVLPVKPGARIELSQDAWIASLDASTQTVITGPTPVCGGVAPTEYDGSGGGGCGFGSSSNSAGSTPEGFGSGSGSGGGPPPVTVVSQSVVGPYDAVTVRSSQGEALGGWLRTNGYEVPLTIQPTIDAFTAAGFDFIALKLAPGEGVQAMQPVRVVTPGADPSLPLRMVAAGVGAYVGVELYVLSEGRYHPQNFPDVTVDFSKLTWDPIQNRSNYTELAQAALASGSGTGWLTESSQPAQLYNASGPNPALATTYQSTCIGQPIFGGCAALGKVASPPAAGEGGAGGEAGSDATASPEAGSDVTASPEGGGDGAASPEAGDDGATADAAGDGGGSPEAGGCGMQTAACDDLSLAMTGITTGNLWVTRLRANLPVGALANDLVLEAAASQDTVTNLHTTSTYSDPSYQPCPSASGASPSSRSSSGSCACRTVESRGIGYGHAIALLAGAVGIAFGLRRRRSRW
jgi:hypothetical protein